jgi:hypothetical protein
LENQFLPRRRKGTSQILCFKESCESCQYEPECVREYHKIRVGPGMNIREAFRSRPGYLLASIDYAQIEIRTATQLSGEPVWRDAFARDADLHYEMAQRCFKTEKPSDRQRDQAKACNFGNLFLGTAQTLALQSNLSFPEAVFVHDQWWSILQVYKAWTDSQLASTLASGFCSTYFGRRRPMKWHIEQAKARARLDQRPVERCLGSVHRICVNTPVQGTAADLMKLGMIRAWEWIHKNDFTDQLRILTTVHDELLFEVEQSSRTEAILTDVSNEMILTTDPAEDWKWDQDLCLWRKSPHPVPVIPGWFVPLKTDVEIGDNWADVTKVKRWKEAHGLTEAPGGSQLHVASESFHPVVYGNVREAKSLVVEFSGGHNPSPLLLAKVRSAVKDELDGEMRDPVLVSFRYETADGRFQEEQLGWRDREGFLASVPAKLEDLFGVSIRGTDG